MTDLIACARKEWCEIHDDEEGCPHVNVCPPEVVAALLDVLENLIKRDVRLSQGGYEALLAKAAITRALEQKP